MRYFHRTSLPPGEVLAEVDRYLAGQLALVQSEPRRRVYGGTMGRVAVTAKAEGGHYTLVEVITDQVGESEADKLAKRLLGMVHKRVHPEHEVRGAY